MIRALLYAGLAKSPVRFATNRVGRKRNLFVFLPREHVLILSYAWY